MGGPDQRIENTRSTSTRDPRRCRRLVIVFKSDPSPNRDRPSKAEVPDAWKLTLIQLHRSLGLTIWIVTVMRLVWRQFARFPDWPANMSRAMRGAARSIEYLLYSLLLLQPILGFLHSNAHAAGLISFFSFACRSLWIGIMSSPSS